MGRKNIKSLAVEKIIISKEFLFVEFLEIIKYAIKNHIGLKYIFPREDNILNKIWILFGILIH